MRALERNMGTRGPEKRQPGYLSKFQGGEGRLLVGAGLCVCAMFGHV